MTSLHEELEAKKQQLAEISAGQHAAVERRRIRNEEERKRLAYKPVVQWVAEQHKPKGLVRNDTSVGSFG